MVPAKRLLLHSLSSGYANPHYNLGLSLAVLGDRDGAATAFRRALELRPDFDAARAELAALKDDPDAAAGGAL